MPHPKKPKTGGQRKVDVIDGRAVEPGTTQPIGFRPGETPTGTGQTLGEFAPSASQEQLQRASDLLTGAAQPGDEGPNQSFASESDLAGEDGKGGLFDLRTISELAKQVEENPTPGQMLALSLLPIPFQKAKAILGASKFFSNLPKTSFATGFKGFGARKKVFSSKDRGLVTKATDLWGKINAVGKLAIAPQNVIE